ncbi:MAG TPA: divalent metal cation transporter, partial [Candidatus Brocadiia bacterium]|nr:divalent metal cation transporter [Candidatus Brocadiia bacterium]
MKCLAPLKRVVDLIGPGLVTAAVVLGPGSITVASKSGALMGCSILWAVVAASVMMAAYTHAGARIGMTAGAPLLTVVARTRGRWLAALMGLAAFCICVGFQTGDNVGVGIALAEMFGMSMNFWSVVFTIVALGLLWGSRSLYQAVERLMMVLVAVMIAAFFGNLLMVRPSPSEVLNGLVPSKPAVFGLVVAVSATTFSVAAAAFQAYLVQSKGWTPGDLKKGFRDSIVGIAALGAISCVIMITSATVLRPAGIKVNTAVDMALQLEPLLGASAKWLFLTGLWAGAFSSFVVNAMVGGALLADGLGLGGRLDSFWAKVLASVVMLLGTAAAWIFGANPIQLLILAQCATMLGAPIIAAVICMLANNRAIMGSKM